MMVRLPASAWSGGCAKSGARLGQTAGIMSYRMVAKVAENIALIVDTAIAITLTSNSHKAASATSFCCEASRTTKDCRISASPGVPVASTAIVPSTHMSNHRRALAPAYIPSTRANASGVRDASMRAECGSASSAAILSQFVVSTIG